MSLQFLRTLFSWGGERDVEWMVKEGGVLAVIRRLKEKEERNRFVMYYACVAASAFLRPLSRPIRRLKEDWNGTKEWREVMWMMEEEGEIDSMCAGKEGYGLYWVKQVLSLLGICCRK
jgi:hypothetical protein